MNPEIAPSVVEAQRMEEGVIITFENGASAIYSAALLYSIFDQAAFVCGPDAGTNDSDS